MSALADLRGFAPNRCAAPDFAPNLERLKSTRDAAGPLGLTIFPSEARGLDALEQAFALMVREHAQAFVMQGDTVLFNYRSQIADMALGNRLPAASLQREYAEAGFPLTYGANPRSLSSVRRFRRQDLQGCEPANLPVEQPTKYELVINLRTAKALGVIVPPMLLTRADEVIE